MESYEKRWTQLIGAGERYAFKRIKSDAAAVRREFSITLEWFADQCHKPCHYCGRADRNNISVKSRSKKGGMVVDGFKYNGLDRLDNTLGYTVDNCVPCCAICNRAKNSMGYNEFIEYLTDLINFRNTGDNHEQPIYDLRIQPKWSGGQAGYANYPQIRTSRYVFEDGALRGTDPSDWTITITGGHSLAIMGFPGMGEEESDDE